MNYITSELDLDQEIIRLETKSKVQEEVLKDNILSMFNKEKITEYLKDGISEIASSSDFKYGVFDLVLGFTSSELSAGIYNWASKKPIRRLVLSGLLCGISQIGVNNELKLKSFLQSAFNAILNLKRPAD
ncbi:MAG: hypothetical protein KA251_06810 [Saprospiraceae bacterium]|nr:hypothetical protein [Candidatus Vicinibacter affinis]MBP6172360.1 hypothetical protein [Saprospiraceae bacterium]MBK6573829.1 hypothetical protein [Candidatus Vicinibacter affinis]MBK7302777.1 hypothetical protein [Candidatus Vicinibacter affinis]MBK7695266.1 hypothetical protein [Candidatus Vicinibacter affinis]